MRIRRILIGIAAGALTLAVLIVVGPRPVRTGEPTGNPVIANSLKNNLTGGEGNLAGFVYDNGEVRFGGLGADEHTEMEIGSITKTFNAELLRQQIEQGMISLDTTVGELIDVGDAPIGDVTVEELVNHTAGLERVPVKLLSNPVRTALFNGNPYWGATPDDIVNYAAKATLNNRGERGYSNYGHALLGQLLARNAGMSYEELLRTAIFKPAGMNSTHIPTPGDTSLSRGVGLSGRPVEPWTMNGWAPAGAIRSTPADMARYVRWLDEHPRPEFGWFDYEHDGTSYPFHNGGTGGFLSMLVWDPHNPHRAAFVANASSSARVEDLGVNLLTATGKEQP